MLLAMRPRVWTRRAPEHEEPSLLKPLMNLTLGDRVAQVVHCKDLLRSESAAPTAGRQANVKFNVERMRTDCVSAFA